MVNHVTIYRAFFDCKGISEADKDKCMKWFYGPLHEAGYQLLDAITAAENDAELTLAFKGFIQYRCPGYEFSSTWGDNNAAVAAALAATDFEFSSTGNNVWGGDNATVAATGFAYDNQCKLVPVCNEDPPMPIYNDDPPIDLYNGPPCSITVNTGTDFNSQPGFACPVTDPTLSSSPLLPSQGEDFIPVPPADDDDASSATHDSMPPLEGMRADDDIDQHMKEFYMADYADLAKMHPHHEFPPLLVHMDVSEISDIYYTQVQVLKEYYLRRYLYLVRSQPNHDFPQLDVDDELDDIMNTYHREYERVVGLGIRYIEMDEPENKVMVTSDQIKQMTGNDSISFDRQMSLDEITQVLGGETRVESVPDADKDLISLD